MDDGTENKSNQRRNVRVWIEMGLWVAGALILAYGLVPRVFNRPAPVKSDAVVEHTRVLLAGFAGDSSAEAVRIFVESLALKGIEGPVIFRQLKLAAGNERAESRLKGELETWHPNIVLLVSEHRATANIRLEIQAFDGSRRQLAILPVHALQARLKAAGYPAVISYAVDSGVPNHVLYRLVQWTLTQEGAGRPRVAGLVQMPSVQDAGWSAAALRVMVEELLARRAR